MVTTNGIRKFKARRRRRRVSNATKVKFQRPTASNQRKQIMANTVAVKRLYSAVLSNRVYCDWQMVGQVHSVNDPAGFTRNWACYPLTDYNSWGPCLRRDVNVAESAATMVERLSLNFRYSLMGSNWAQYNVFIVTPRKDAAAVDLPVRFTSGTFPVVQEEYTEGPDAFNFRLNPAIFKVHYASYRTLTATTLFGSVTNAKGANPFTTWAKGQVNLRSNIRVRMPSGTSSWKTLPYMHQAYYKRYFLLVCIVQDADAGVPVGSTAQFSFDQLATTMNIM